MVAVALFGAVVTVILSAQGGPRRRATRRAANMGQAIELGRCKMTEIEEKLLKLGYPEIEEKDTSRSCCDDKEVDRLHAATGRSRASCCPRRRRSAATADSRRSLGGGLGLDAGAGRSRRASPTSLGEPARAVLVNPLGGARLDLDGGLAGHGAVAAADRSAAAGRAGPALDGDGHRLPVAQADARGGDPARHRRRCSWKEGPIDARASRSSQYVTNP